MAACAALLTWLAAAAVARGAGFVQGVASTPEGSRDRVSVRLPSAQAEGDLNVVFVAWRGTAAHVTSVTDTSGNIYVAADAQSFPGMATQAVYFAKNIRPAARGDNVVTVSLDAGAGDVDVRVAEYSGLDRREPLDGTAGASGTSGTVTSGPFASPRKRELLVASAYAGEALAGPGPGYTQRLLDADGSIVEDQFISAGGSASATAMKKAPGWFVMQVVAFRESPPPPLNPPYPQSRAIAGMSWNFSTVLSHRKALGSDLWPTAWGADGNLYAAWGDGGGFDGTELGRPNGRSSLGFARIDGTPEVSNPASFRGSNLWGQAPRFALEQAGFGGKTATLVSVDGVLYAWGGFWTAQNCGCPDPTIKSRDNESERTLIWSEDFGRTWQMAPWTSPTDQGSPLKFGRDYSGAFEPGHVYFYYEPDIHGDPGRVFLRRVAKQRLKEDPAVPGHFEFFSGLDPHGTPRWSPMQMQSVPVFYDPNTPSGVHAGPAVVYDAPLGRYIATVFHGPLTGQVGFFEALQPWGPWSTVAYYDDWGGLNERAGIGNGLSFPPKWISDDGRTLWALFSGANNGGANEFDSLNVAQVILKTQPAH